MSKSVSVAEAKQGLTKLLREAKHRHEEVVITNRGEPFMVIMPYEGFKRLEQLKAYLNMIQISDNLKGTKASATELVKESRRELETRH